MKRLTKSIRGKLTLIFISVLCIACIISLALVMGGVALFRIKDMDGNMLMGLVSAICIIIGSILMFVVTKFISRPIKGISDITKEISKGNFDIAVNYKGNDEIGTLSDNFNLMAKELKNMEYLRKDFMSNVSHEFKTPLASIQGFAEIIKDKNLPREKFEEYTDIIIEETKRLNNLSANMLRLSRLDNQLIQSKKVIFSLDEQLRKTILLLEEQWNKKNLELEIDLDKVKYEGDEELIQQIWVNLIGNSIKFSHNEGVLHISLKQKHDSIIVKIKDEGIGISEEAKVRVYEKFYQQDKSRSKEGNGLGLAIVKRIIEICEGSICFESKVGEGTCFRVELPR
ncbi:HAMP domain-containing sensor histidine kinase [Clostridium intestinale]|uniref:Heme sensor protein HssS n=2 Tax=Clostridium intestinale TaxID=36845 RepID=U2Q1Q4_9CLOT|nr:HAMP domain-containing sensor histidine kinase [Clostridium intestinale]ERK29979.1 signal transduction histidine kinase [Clostridium intestinale URNW]QLY81337.1 HAMP domain-containing histidine kinase [Clostridium intestinale]